MTVQSLDRALRLALRHVDEAEAAWLAGFTIIDQLDRIHLAVTLEEHAHVLLGGIEWQISHVNRRHPNISLKSGQRRTARDGRMYRVNETRQVKASRHTIGSFQ